MSSAYYKRLLSKAQDELKKYKKRKGELEAIWSYYGSFDSDASELNQYYGRASGFIQEAVKISGGSVDVRELWGKLDWGSNDGNLSSSRTYVNIELTRVSNKIRELNDQIAYLKRMIEKEKAREKAGKA